jgi:hypothetical protein|tara:strand:+ start:40 stop:1065 length:1026 start_codon:yes stop_codon:yes gene_type:complete
MEKNLLKNGKIIFPKTLNLKKKINVGIIGSGKLAMEYIAVIESFNHKLVYLFSPTNNKNAQLIAKKNKAKYLSDYKEVLSVNDVDVWIVCTSWHKLKEVFFKISKIKKPILFEKSLTLTTKEISKILRIKNFPSIKKMSFAYNRNYYDYIYFLCNFINKNKLTHGSAFFFDAYRDISKKHKIPNSFTPHYITSHWISLIFKIFKICNIKIVKIVQKNIIKSNNLNFKKISIIIKQKNQKIEFDIFNFPNLPNNHTIKLFFTKKIIEISPIEKIKIFNSINKKNLGKYSLKYDQKIVDNKFKPGLRFQYYDFINHHLNKKKSVLTTPIRELLEIYKICELLR